MSGSAAQPLVLLAAGGTGGHLFPAEALAGVLGKLGVRTALVTDTRVGHISGFKGDVHQVAAATPSGGSLIGKARAALMLGKGVLEARRLIKRLKPAMVVGFGGYPTVPPILAAAMLGVPTLVHEQNAVAGRANRFLAGRVKAIATGFPTVAGLTAEQQEKVIHTGNPVRDTVRLAAERPYPEALRNGMVRLLVFGGSQGASVMAQVVPAAIEQMPKAALERLAIVQQARGEDLEKVKTFYTRFAMKAEVAPFFKDLPEKMAAAHLVISRSGASTVAELAAIGRPAILVPYPGALDQDQTANAKLLGDVGAAKIIQQRDFTPERLVQELTARLADPDGLTRDAQAAKSAGTLDAAEKLAAAVIKVGRLSVPAAA